MQDFLYSQNFPYLVFAISVFVFLFYLFSFFKIKGMMENDKNHKTYYENGAIKEEGKHRNRWDYNIFGGLTRMWHASEWQEFVGIILLSTFLIIYLFTNDSAILQLISINVGVIFGMQIPKYINKK